MSEEGTVTGMGAQNGKSGGISFIEVNLNHCFEASRVLVLKLTSCNINVSLKESWTRGNQLGLKASKSQLYGADQG